MTLALVLIAAYLLGSIPTSYILVYARTGRDIRSMGSGNPGTMNVLDTQGFFPAFIVGAGDIVKGMAAVGIAYLVGLDDAEAVMAAVVAVAGHDYSIFLRLHGGNGMAPAIGGFLALSPVPTLAAIGVSGAIWLVVHSRRAAGLVGLALIPTFAYWAGAPDTKLFGLVILIVIVAAKIFRFEGFSPARVRHDR